MKSTTVLRFHGTVSTREEAAAHLRSPGDAVLIERGRPRWLILSCPCGCGEHFPINLDPRAGPAWRLYINRGAVTVYPSVWRESGCCSHYIIWRDRILLFGQNEEDLEFPDDETLPLPEAVYERLPAEGMVLFSEIAEALDALPWDVLKICRRLVRKGLVREGRAKQRGWFGRA